MISTDTEIIEAIRQEAAKRGRPPSRAEFMAASGVSESRILRVFPSWNAAVRTAGFVPNEANRPLDRDALLADWGALVRAHRAIPTRQAYRREGGFSPQVFEKRIGAWSAIPDAFREWAAERPEWSDVLVLLPPTRSLPERTITESGQSLASDVRGESIVRARPLAGRPTYGNPLDFRGLRHEPVNEQGVVFLFGMVARELGYLVEALQAGYPDCEAKRQVGPGRWQRVRIEFEFESRNFRDHGHPSDGCDVIVCWRHNWPDCPSHIEVVALENALPTLAADEVAV